MSTENYVDVSCVAMHDNLDEILEYYAGETKTITLVTGKGAEEISTSGN